MQRSVVQKKTSSAIEVPKSPGGVKSAEATVWHPPRYFRPRGDDVCLLRRNGRQEPLTSLFLPPPPPPASNQASHAKAVAKINTFSVGGRGREGEGGGGRGGIDKLAERHCSEQHAYV